MGKVVVVDENDVVIGSKERKELTTDDIARKSVLWVTNSVGQVLLTQRSPKKDKGAGLWSAAAAGTVDEGEDYLSNIIKEAAEEIGLTVIPEKLVVRDKVRVKNFETNHFAQWYTYSVDKDSSEFTLQPDEVADIKWMEPSEVSEFLARYPEQCVPTAPLWKSMGLIP